MQLFQEIFLATIDRRLGQPPFRPTAASGEARPAWYNDGPVARGRDWLSYVPEPQTDAELVALRRSVQRGVPYGGETWLRRTVKKLGLESTLRPRGRPRKVEK